MSFTDTQSFRRNVASPWSLTIVLKNSEIRLPTIKIHSIVPRIFETPQMKQCLIIDNLPATKWFCSSQRLFILHDRCTCIACPLQSVATTENSMRWRTRCETLGRGLCCSQFRASLPTFRHFTVAIVLCTCCAKLGRW